MTAQSKSIFDGIFGQYEGAMDRQIEEDRRAKGMADDYPTQLPQYFGKRVEYMTMKNGNVEVTICNSSRKQIGRTVVIKSIFASRPTTSNEVEVKWACEVVGISMK